MATSSGRQLPARGARATANFNLEYVESEEEFPEEIAGMYYIF